MKIINVVKPVKRATCEKCGTELEYEDSDIEAREFGCAYIKCPNCGKYILLEDEEGLVLTPENFNYPQHFYVQNPEESVKISDEQINNWIIEICDYFRKHKSESNYICTSGDTMVLGFRDEDYVDIYVAKNYCETSIFLG